MSDNASGLAEALAAAGLVSGDVSERARKARVGLPAASTPTRCMTR